MCLNNRCLGLRYHGLTLVELLTVVAVLAVLLSTALPSFSSMLYASRLRGVADVLIADLRHALSESKKLGSNVLVTFKLDADGSNWCYGASVATDCDCRSTGSCLIDGTERVANGNNSPGILATPTHSSYWFKTRRTTATAGNILLTAQDGKQLKIVISGYGRIRACSPSGNSNLGGYPVCP